MKAGQFGPIAERLRALRIVVVGDDRGAQMKWCRDLGILPQSWNGYETGNARIGVDSAIRIVRRFGVTLDWIYLGDTRAMPHALLTDIERVRTAKPDRANSA
jgi:hypothetical protein